MKMKGHFVLTVNGSAYGVVRETNEVLAACLATWVHHLAYMPEKAIVDNMINALEMLQEVGEVRGAMKHTKNVMENCLRRLYDKWVGAKTDDDAALARQQLLTYVSDTLLRCEGLGVCYGFGYAAFDTVEGRKRTQGSSTVNPEKQSITHYRRRF